MKIIEEYDFTNKEVEKLPTWFTEGEFEKLVRVVEGLMNDSNEFIKALSIFDERKMDAYFINLLAKFWNISESTLTSQKLIDILVLKIGLIKPATLTTLYLISSLFFSSQNIFIQEDNASVFIYYAFGQLIGAVNLVDDEGDFIVTESGDSIVLAVEEDDFNAFNLLSKSLAAGIQYQFVEEQIVALTLVDDEDNFLVDDAGNNFVANLDNSISLSSRIKYLLEGKNGK